MTDHPQAPTEPDSLDAEVAAIETREPIAGVFLIRVTMRGAGRPPTVTDLTDVIEAAVSTAYPYFASRARGERV